MQWSFAPESRNREPDRIAEVVLAVAFSLSLSAGFLDVGLGILPAPPGLSSFPLVLTILAVTTCFFFVVYVVLWTVIGYPLGRFFKLQATPLAVSLGLLLGITFFLALLGGLIHFPLSPNDLFKLLLVLSLSLLTSVAAYLASKAFARRSGSRTLAMSLSLAAPVVLAEATVSLWLHKYRLGPVLSTPSILVTVGCALIAFFTVRFAVRFGPKVKIVRWLAVFMALAALSPLVTLLSSKNWGGSAQGLKKTDDGIKHAILITVDTLRADVLSRHGPQGELTPHIDELARDGILFKKAMSIAPWTLPSFASIMTGLSPQVHMTTKVTTKLPENLTTLGEHMRDADYETIAIGSNVLLAPGRNLSQGFVRYDFFPIFIGSSFGARILQRLFPDEFNPSTRGLTKLAINWLNSNREKNFFLWIHYFDPHHPYGPPAKFLSEKEPPPRIGTVFTKQQEVRGGLFVPSPTEKQWIRELYEGEVRYVDENIGELLDALKQLNLYDDSLIVFTSDHGEEFWEHGGFEHGHTLYNEVLWVPLILKLPHSTSRRVLTKPVATPSLMPTILDLCKVDYAPDHLSFSSLVPLWGPNPDTFETQPIVSSSLLYFEDRESVIFRALKYIRFRWTTVEELYDLDRDPGEKQSLALSSPDKVDQARNILGTHVEISKKLRKVHGIDTEERIRLDEETIERLKGLGYVQ